MRDVLREKGEHLSKSIYKCAFILEIEAYSEKYFIIKNIPHKILDENVAIRNYFSTLNQMVTTEHRR